MAPRVNDGDNEQHNTDKPAPRLALESAALASEQDLLVLRLFNHYRHDWMNDIQILMGYVQLKKYDKLQAMMEKIKDKVQQESLISKLGIPSLIVYLLSFQTEVKELQLHMRMSEEIRLQELPHAHEVAEGVKALMEGFKQEAVSSTNSEVNTLELTWSKQDRTLCLDISYEGGYLPERLQRLEASLNSRWKTGGWSIRSRYDERSVVWAAAWTY
ncbi:Spo0B domain-containing protein [Paenibacillus validus]|uniref:SpoOB alpha-helical domain-containing protein n=2 Tax=Paenibacillus TaxID=44249 RepID=A0A7X2Z6F3_9BACL|nr:MULTISPECIES: Spo0B domain-containing protein [Paenibacillus]MED4603851.1 Spo0B domain-containing protein [Paenibacillus validus]MED4606158.1 Spo0B domain-containing protein [Paenibacillus validus]MUG69138.1 hypothetical protein [Paenibacillus validus]